MCRRVYEAIGEGEVQTLVFSSSSIEMTYLLRIDWVERPRYLNALDIRL